MPMDCGDCVERVYSYLDRELEPAEVAQVKAHLAECGDCDSDFVFEQRFLDLLKEHCTSDQAPAELRERIVLRLRGHAPGER